MIIFIKGEISDSILFSAFLAKMDNEFPVPLSKKANLEDYATKLLVNGSVFFAKDEEKLIGIIAGYNNTQKGYISVLVLDPEYRGRKISVTLLDMFLNECKENRVELVEVFTHKTNVEAQGLYEKFGFVAKTELIDECVHYLKKID